MEEIGCIFCDTYDNPVVISENGYKARRCPTCGLIYVSPRPSSETIRDTYEGDHARMVAGSHIHASSLPRLYERHHVNILKKARRAGAIIEIGAGSGSFLDEARKNGYNVFAIEPNPVQAEFIKNNFGIACETRALSPLSFGGRKFDIVYHRDVTSHFADPVAEFTNMNEKLSNDGLLVFETGFYGHNRFIKLFHSHQLPGHLFTFSDKNIGQLLDKAGFKLLKNYRYSSLPSRFMNRLLSPLMNSVKTNGKYSFSSSESAGTEEPLFVHLSRLLYAYLLHFLRYKAGHIFPKGDGPQKIIIIAVKK